LYPFTNVTTTIRVRRKRMYIWKSISCEKISILNILKFRLYSPQWNLKTARIFIFNRMIEAIAPHLIVWLIWLPYAHADWVNIFTIHPKDQWQTRWD
jgi:hypothetical protein